MRAISRSGQHFDKVLADEDLSDLLAEKGFAVARRTVTKYRELLGIPNGRKGVWFLAEFCNGFFESI